MRTILHFSVILLLVCTVKLNIVKANTDVEDADLTVNYNETCKPNGPHCNRDKGLDCINGICKCKPSFNSEGKLVHIEEDVGCVPIAKQSEGWTCKYDIQCQESIYYGNASYCLRELTSKTGNCECKKNSSVDTTGYNCKGSNINTQTQSFPLAARQNNWDCNLDSECVNSVLGKYSRCNTNTRKCECYDTDMKGREASMVEDVCYVKKELDETCTSNKECNATIVGEAICQGLGNRATTVGVCKCADKHIFEPNSKECLKLGTLHSICKLNFQCQHLEALGELSRCQESSKTCDCWDTRTSGQKYTKFYKEKCYYSRGVNETCNEKIECILGYHKNADCLVHPSFDGGKTCQCSPEADCSTKNSSSMPSTSLIIPIVSIFNYVYLRMNQS